MKCPEKLKWSKGISNEIGRLFQGIGDIQGTNNCFFVQRHKVTQGAKVTYSYIVYDTCPQKKETHLVQLTVGGYKLNFDGPFSTPIENLTTSKLHWNSIISTPGAKYLVVDINNFYLNNLMSKHEY